eukprot:TCONS_00034787-protein
MTSTSHRITPNPFCTPSACADDQKESLQCTCNRLVHYICSRLPPYMISVFKDSRRTKNGCNYVCPNCVKVSPDLLNTYHGGIKKQEKYAIVTKLALRLKK